MQGNPGTFCTIRMLYSAQEIVILRVRQWDTLAKYNHQNKVVLD